jgi:hypothetical protein
MTEMFCSQTQTNFATDKVLQDSINSFFIRHQTDSTTVIAKDSIYKYERVGKLKCKETGTYENNGFGCECVR